MKPGERVDEQPEAVSVESLQEAVERLSVERDQLAEALQTRIVVEQAKGVLAERYGLSIEDAFALLRQSARAARVRIHLLAADVVDQPATPHAILRGIAREGRWRALAVRERAEATAERAATLHAKHLDQLDRLSRWTRRTTVRIRTQSRADAVALGARLQGYRWHLLGPDGDRWEVFVDLDLGAAKLPDDLRRRIQQWLGACGLRSAPVVVGGDELELLEPGGAATSD